MNINSEESLTVTENKTITVDDLQGLDALPTGTEIHPYGRSFKLVRTEAGMGYPDASFNTEYTTSYIAGDYLPASIVNPEHLGSEFAGIGDRVRIVEDDDYIYGTDYTGAFGILRQINDQSSDSLAFRVELEAPVYPAHTHHWVKAVAPAPLPAFSTTPQIGDRVRVIREYTDGGGFHDGATGTLVEFRENSRFPYAVNIDDFGRDIVHSIEFESDPVEASLEYPLVHDGEAFDALPYGTILVPLDKGLTAVQNHGNGGGWRCFQPDSYDLTEQTRNTVIDDGALVVYQG